MSREIVVMDRKTIQWTAKQLVGAMRKGTAVFNNACQRSLVWNVAQKSLLIHSLLINAPIPPFYTTRNSETKVYDFLDGKQRSNAVFDFVEGNFALEGVPEVVFDDGSTEDINGKTFEELDEEMRDAILSYSLSIVYIDDIDEEETADIFYRLNNGKSLSAIEVTRVRCQSIQTIQSIAQHEVFDTLSDKARARYVDEDLVIKSFAMLKMDEPCLDTKVIRPFAESLDITADDEASMREIFDRLATIHDNIEDSKVAKKLYGRTHLVTLVGFLANHDEDEDETITDMLANFFDGGRAGTVSDRYNGNARSGSGHAPQIKARLEELENALNEEVEA